MGNDLRALKIKNKTKVKVAGKVDYCHIATKIDGDELKRANQYTQYPSKDPYYKITLTVSGPDAFIFDKNDESAVKLAAFLASKKIYQSKKEEKKGINYFTATSKGNEIRVYKEVADGEIKKVNLNNNELGKGCEVEIELNYFEASNGPGIGLNAVVIKGDIIKFEGNTGVEGYKQTEGSIDLEPRTAVMNDAGDAADESMPDDVAPAEDAKDIEVDEAPIGSTSSANDEAFAAILQQFKS